MATDVRPIRGYRLFFLIILLSLLGDFGWREEIFRDLLLRDLAIVTSGVRNLRKIAATKLNKSCDAEIFWLPGRKNRHNVKDICHSDGLLLPGLSYLLAIIKR